MDIRVFLGGLEKAFLGWIEDYTTLWYIMEVGLMNVFKHKHFSKWAKREGIKDAMLKKAVEELNDGLTDGDLGGGLHKKRVARYGEGKRSGYRTLLAFKRDNRSIFIFGFAKNERSNIGDREKVIFKKLARDYLLASEKDIAALLTLGELIEVI